MEAMDSVRRYMAGFRMPDVSKLWGVSPGIDEDQVDSPTPLIIRLEYYLVRCQELALWKDPKASLVALAAVHLAFGYLATTSNTVVNLTLWALLSGFVYTTWTQRIWPEIRVPEAEGEQAEASGWTPVSPDVYSAPELIELAEKLKAKALQFYHTAVALRSEKPGVFCACSSATCLALWYLGTLVSTLGLLYYLVVGSFVMPGLVKVMLTQSPEFSQFLKQFCDKRDEVDSGSSRQPVSAVAEKVPEVSSQQEAASSIGHQVSGVMQSVCSSLTSGVASLTAQLPELPDMSSLEQKKQELLGSGKVNNPESDSDYSMEESMSPYLPDNDLASHQILESCTRDSALEDPTQPDSFQSGQTLDEDDLLPSPTIPGHEEPELAALQQESASISSTHSSSIGATAGTISPTSQRRLSLTEEEEEFLPTAAGTRDAAESSDNSCDLSPQQQLSPTVYRQQKIAILKHQGRLPSDFNDGADSSLISDSFGEYLKREVAQAVDGTPTPGQDSGRKDSLDSSDDDFGVLSASEILKNDDHLTK